MANSSSASSHTTTKSSRFSTLNVFKFSSKDRVPKPPPLPPKDPYYLPNKSLASLALPPDSLSVPPSPMSPISQYAQRPSPDWNPSASSMSVVSSAASTRSFVPVDGNIPSHPQPRKKPSFFKFAKRNKSSRNLAELDDIQPPEIPNDEGITRPFNFQHNIHVDEGYTGLPPSWATSLVSAGFSEEEIANIQARRAASARSPSIYTTDRPHSPASTIATNNLSHHPDTHVLTRPTPRTTSLPRQYSDASIRNNAQAPAAQMGHLPPQRPPPPLPSAPSLTSSPSMTSIHSHFTSVSQRSHFSSQRQFSTTTEQMPYQPSISSMSMSVDSRQSTETSVPSERGGLGMTLGSQRNGSSRAGTAEPTTPPRRTYHIANATSPLNSPPPAYTSAATGTNGYPVDTKDWSRFTSTSTSRPEIETTPAADTDAFDSYNSNRNTYRPIPTPPPAFTYIDEGRDGQHNRNESSATADSASTSGSSQLGESSSAGLNRSPSTQSYLSTNSKRMTVLPPRLSLHKHTDSTDLSSWGEAVISAIPELSSSGSNGNGPSSFAKAQTQGKKGHVYSHASGSGSGSGSSSSTSSLRSAGSGSSMGRLQAPQVVGAGPSPLKEQTWRQDEEKIQKQQKEKEKEDGKKRRPPPPTRPIPTIVLREDEQGGRYEIDDGYEEVAEEKGDSRRVSSLWTGSGNSSASTPRSGFLDGVLGSLGESGGREPHWAALNDAFSPVLPLQPAVEIKQDKPPQSPSIGGRMGVEEKSSRRSSAYREDEDENLLSAADRRERDSNRDSSQSSTSTLSTSTITGLTAPTIVRGASIARRAGAYVINKAPGASGRKKGRENVVEEETGVRSSMISTLTGQPPSSPLSSHFGSDGEGSTSSSSLEQDHHTPTTDVGTDSELMYYVEPSPDSTKLAFATHPHHSLLVSATDTFGGYKEDVEEDYEVDDDDEGSDREEEDEGENGGTLLPHKPMIVINGGSSLSETGHSTAMTATTGYRGWLSEVVAPLLEFIDDAVDPRAYYLDLQEIAEGESGSVFAARVVDDNTASLRKLKLPAHVRARDSEELSCGRKPMVAIKNVAIVPSGSPKLVDLKRELTLMKGMWHEHVLGLDAVYVDLVEDSLWIRMELMERSLADIIGLVGSGLMMQDRMIARFASDVLQALEYLQKQNIAHRDVRSDNLLLNSHGVLKLTDFSNAVRVTREAPMCSDLAGVVYWQAPEVRSPPYNALKIDVWSLGATVWEMAEAEPPFMDMQEMGDRWPPLSKPEIYSPAFHDFLRQCSEPATSRPGPSELMKSQFLNNACGRAVIVQLLSQCMAIEQELQEGEDSQGPIS